MPDRRCSDLDAQARRRLIQLSAGLLACAGLSAAAVADAAHPPPRADSPRVGVDPLFVEAGLTGRWKVAMGRDLGWQAQWMPLSTAEVLRQLEAGELDAGMFLSHPRADALDKEGLIHNRRTIATTPVWLVGPADDQAGIRGESDAGRVLSQVLLAAQAGAIHWAAPAEASPLAGLLAQLTQGHLPRLAKAPSERKPPAGPAYELVTRAQWRPDRRKVWLQGDARMVLAAQVACSFRSRHPGAKLLVNWLGWPVAQSAFRQAGPGWQGRPASAASSTSP
jgi:tungstate transport system substrate-binding protein